MTRSAIDGTSSKSFRSSLQGWNTVAAFEARYDEERLQRSRTEYVNCKELREAFEAIDFAKALSASDLRFASETEDASGFDFEMRLLDGEERRVQTTLVDTEGKINERMAKLERLPDGDETALSLTPIYPLSEILEQLRIRATAKVKNRAKKRKSLGEACPPNVDLLLYLNMKPERARRAELLANLEGAVICALSEFDRVAVLHFMTEDAMQTHEVLMFERKGKVEIFKHRVREPEDVEGLLNQCFPASDTMDE